MQRSLVTTLFVFAAIMASSCSGGMRPGTPLDTLKAYHVAIIKKDAAAMKSYLSKASIEMAEKDAKANNTSVDEVLLRESLFTEGQKTVKVRDEKIDGDKASIWVQNPFGQWDEISFVREGGSWKIDKAKFQEDLLKQAEEDQRRMDDEINKGRIETDPAPVSPLGPGASPLDMSSPSPTVTPSPSEEDTGLPEGMKKSA